MKTLDLDKDKLQEQQRFIEVWKKANARGVLEACTGYGKTTVGLLAIQEMNQSHPERVTHVVVPTNVLKKQWEVVILQWELSNVVVWVVNTYIKEVRYTNLLVLDEIHRYGSDTFRLVFQKSRFNFILGLTATLERQDGMHLLINKYAPVLRSISLNEALAKGFVSDFKVYNLGVKLAEGEMETYRDIQNHFDKYFQVFNNDFEIAKSALTDAFFRYNYGLKMGMTSTEIYIQAALFSRYLQMRKAFLNEIPSKISTVIELWDILRKKMIVFCETTAFADRIAETLGEVSFAYHNAVSDKKLMKQRLEDFKDGTGSHQVVVAVKAIEEGLDVPDLDMVVIVSGNSTKRQYIQRMGRSLRVQPGKTALIINTYVHGTKDEDWLRSRQWENAGNINWISSAAEIYTENDAEVERP